MIAIEKTRARFNSSTTIDLANDKKLFLIINILAVVLVAVFYFVFYFLGRGIIEESSSSIFYYATEFDKLPVLYNLLFFASLIFTIVFHETIHGLFFYIFTGAKPVFGFKKMMAYAGAPDWYIRKDKFIIITLAPFVVISSICLVFLAIASKEISIVVFMVSIIHAASCVGDFWYAAVLINKQKETYINDSGTIATINNDLELI